MTRFRSYLEPSESTPEETLSLNSEESHHLLRVRRAKIADPVTVFDGKGNEYQCLLESVSDGTATLRVDSRSTSPPPSCRITLAQSILKGQGMDQVFQRGTELGVSHFVPISPRRSVVSLSGDRYERRLSRWRTLTVESCKQSGNPFLPSIDPITSLEEFCSRSQEDALRLICSLKPEATTLISAISEFRRIHSTDNPTATVFLIGPEGDFTREEYQIACEAGFTPITLSDNTLRSETAATVCIALLRHELR